MKKWDNIIARLQGPKYELPSEEVLLTFNNDPIEAINEFYDIRADSTISILMLGNSLTLTGAPEEEEDKTHRGLTSTHKDFDYVHRLVKMIAENKGVNVKYSAANFSYFERTFSLYPFDINKKTENIEIKEPNWLILQIGENVAEKDLESDSIFRMEVSKILAHYPDSRKIITLPFWPSKSKQVALTNVALENNCYLVDLSHLGSGTDPDNLASSQKEYAYPGVGEHPGDKGMERIAENIFSVINASE